MIISDFSTPCIETLIAEKLTPVLVSSSDGVSFLVISVSVLFVFSSFSVNLFVGEQEEKNSKRKELKIRINFIVLFKRLSEEKICFEK